jgi:hypothetical protein
MWSDIEYNSRHLWIIVLDPSFLCKYIEKNAFFSISNQLSQSESNRIPLENGPYALFTCIRRRTFLMPLYIHAIEIQHACAGLRIFL